MRFSPIMPTLRYQDADRAIRFLIEGLGFTQHARYEGPNGTVMHAELRRGSGMVMVSTDPGDGQSHDGVEMKLGSASIYVIVEAESEVDKLYQSALRQGARSIREPKNQDYGGRGATVQDLEGHYWSVGSYQPS